MERLRVIGFLMLGSVLCSLALGLSPSSGLVTAVFAAYPLGLIVLAPLIAVGVKVESSVVRYMVAMVIGALATYLGYGFMLWVIP